MDAVTDSWDESCENCAFLDTDDTCGNRDSVYHRRPAVYRDGAEVLQAGWCDRWALSRAQRSMSDV